MDYLSWIQEPHGIYALLDRPHDRNWRVPKLLLQGINLAHPDPMLALMSPES